MSGLLRRSARHERLELPLVPSSPKDVRRRGPEGTETFLGFDFYAAASFDFFSAMYFFMARRFFCLLRLCKFLRASCFILFLLVRRDKPAGCLRMGMPLRDGLRHGVTRPRLSDFCG
jgi:hypothetical protein